MILTITEILNTYDRKEGASPKAPIKNFKCKFSNNAEGYVGQFAGEIEPFVGMSVEQVVKGEYTNYYPVKGQAAPEPNEGPINLADIPFGDEADMAVSASSQTDTQPTQPQAIQPKTEYTRTDISIMKQTSIKAACNLFQGTADKLTALDAAKTFFTQMSGLDW